MTAKPVPTSKAADLTFRGVEFCDGCGAELMPGDVLWGLCETCQEGTPMERRKPARTET